MGAVEAGTIQVLKPDLAISIGTEFFCFKLDKIKVGKQNVDVARLVTIVATDIGQRCHQGQDHPDEARAIRRW